MDDQIRIEGLRELQAALKAYDGESQKQLRVVFNASADLVVAAARPLVPNVSGRSRASVKSRSGQRSATVQAGGSKAKGFGWLDYGGTIRGSGHAPGHDIKRPFKKDGRIIYVAFKKTQPDVEKVLQDGLDALIKATGLDMTHG